MRSLVWATALVVTSSVAVAQPSPEVKDGKQVFTIMLSPMASPKPLSNYYLTPQYKEQQPGDQLSGFMKCFMEQAIFFNAENEAKRQKFLDMPLTELPKEVREGGVMSGIEYPSKVVGNLMQNMDTAARYSRVEWNEYFQARQGGINWLLPEVQYLRRLASVLRLRLRGEIKNGEFDRAITTVKSLTGLARMFERHPTLIGGLVGIAIQTIAWNGVEEMIAQPGCPNLFWSLVELPSPPFDLSKAYEGERTFLTAQLDELLVTDRPLTNLELSRHLDTLDEFTASEHDGSRAQRVLHSPRLRLALFAADTARVEAARGRIVGATKLKATVVNSFSALQIVLADDVLSYSVWRDEMMKWRNLPYAECVAGLSEVKVQMDKKAGELILGPLLLPALSKVKSSEVRNAQRVALLRVLEGIRLHAAASNGELPATLADTKLPMPLDPVTGKAFEYSVKDGVATLTGGNPGGTPTRVYEVRLRK